MHIVSGSVLVTTGGISSNVRTTPAVHENDGGKGAKWVLNGANDAYPNELRTDAEGDTVISPGLRLNAKLLYGGGLVYGRFKKLDSGKLDYQYEYLPQIEGWLRNTNISRQLFTMFYDLSFGGTAYLLFTKSFDGRIRSVRVEHTRYTHCRLNEVNSNGEHTKCYVSPDMGTSSLDPQKVTEYAVAPNYDTVEWVKKLAPGKSYVMAIKAVDTGRQVYVKPDWDSARASDWVAISKSIAALNKSALNNSMRPLWHIKIHQDFWPNYYGEAAWKAWNDTQKRDKVKAYCDVLANELMGAENTGKYVASPVISSKLAPEKLIDMLTFTPLENKVQLGQDGWYLTTSREASQHKLSAMSLTPALTGMMPGDGGMGAGSGSNNRVELNQRVLMAVAEQDMYINWIYHVAEINGWPTDLVWTIKQGLITTLDTGAETTTTAPMNQPSNANNNG